MMAHKLNNISIVVVKPIPAVAKGIASMPAPKAVPATIKVLPKALFFTLSPSLTADQLALHSSVSGLKSRYYA